MPTNAAERCVGCGGEFAAIDGPFHPYMTSSPGCWYVYGDVLGALAVRPDAHVARQLCVDAYAAQHPGTPNPQAIQSVAVHLINMHNYFACGRPVELLRLVGHKGAFHWLTPPSFALAQSVRDMPTAGSNAVFESAARAWARSVWDAWSAQHWQVAEWAERFQAR